MTHRITLTWYFFKTNEQLQTRNLHHEVKIFTGNFLRIWYLCYLFLIPTFFIEHFFFSKGSYFKINEQHQACNFRPEVIIFTSTLLRIWYLCSLFLIPTLFYSAFMLNTELFQDKRATSDLEFSSRSESFHKYFFENLVLVSSIRNYTHSGSFLFINFLRFLF